MNDKSKTQPVGPPQNLNFPPIGDDEPTPAPPEPTAHEKEVAELKKQLEDQNRRFEKQNEDFMRALSTRPQPQVVQQQAPAPAPVEEEIPDVLEDPKAYAEYVQDKAMRNAQAYVNKETSGLKAKYDEDRNYQRVYEKFKSIDPKIATENADLVEFIAVKKVKAAVAQGIDVNVAVFGNEQQFAQDVMDEVKRQLGVSSPPVDRTDGLSPDNRMPSPAPAPAESKTGFVDSMKSLRYR